MQEDGVRLSAMPLSWSFVPRFTIKSFLTACKYCASWVRVRHVQMHGTNEELTPSYLLAEHRDKSPYLCCRMLKVYHTTIYEGLWGNGRIDTKVNTQANTVLPPASIYPTSILPGVHCERPLSEFQERNTYNECRGRRADQRKLPLLSQSYTDHSSWPGTLQL